MTLLIENEQANPYVRSAAMRGLVTVVACGKCTRERIVAYFHALFQKLERTPGEVWDALACRCADLWPGELMDDLRSAWEEELISPCLISWEDIEAWHARGEDSRLQYMNERYTLITDVVKEMARWACFDKDRKFTPREKIAGFQKRFSLGCHYQLAVLNPKLDETTRVRVAAGKTTRNAAAASTVLNSN